MTLRSSLLAALVATLLSAGASAQSPADVPLPALPISSPSGLLASPSPAPTSTASLAACTSASTINNDVVNGTYSLAAGTSERGQSITAPCGGFWTGVRFVLQHPAELAGQTVTGTFRTYDGAGTAGTVLSTQTYTATLPATAGAYFYDVTFTTAVPVTEAQAYTWFYDLTASPAAGLTQHANNNNPYAGGDMYRSTTGDPAAATASTGFDLRFVAFFGPASATVTSGPFYNPSSAEIDGAGWRLLSSPVSGLTVNNLAAMNLVQGYVNQYPAVGSNLLIAYDGSSFYGGTAVTDASFTPRQGTGYFWYFYDRAITPPPTTAGGGTSTSIKLDGFTLSATGTAPNADVSTPYYFASSNGAYMLGNPFGVPFQLSGVSETAATGGTVGTVFSVFDPSIGVSGSYVNLGPTSFVAPWQGFFATSTTTAAPAPTFTFAFASTSTTATPTFYGRGAVAEAGVQFRLDGETAAGKVGDRATEVRFLSDALVGQDRHDGVKLLPPGATYALLAPVADFGGTATRLSVNSLPEALDAATVSLALLATDAGTFTLTWTPTLAGRTASLRDLVTGAVVDLAAQTSYSFASEATDWTDRFELTVGRSAVAGESAPTALRVGTFAPNPATGASRLTLTSDAAQTVRATVVDALGREVMVAFEGALAAGAEATVTVDTARLTPGVYVVRIAGESFAETRRLTVVR